MILRSSHTRVYVLLAGLTGGFAAWFLYPSPPTWERTLLEIRGRYPDVHQISTEAVAEWLADTNRPPPLILDVRTQKEYIVSHLPGALWVDPATDVEELAQDLDPTRSIIAYCSVGDRSSRLAERLHRQGYPDVRNMEGSIFKWFNENRIVIGNHGRTNEVHPYNKRWGQLLTIQ